MRFSCYKSSFISFPLKSVVMNMCLVPVLVFMKISGINLKILLFLSIFSTYRQFKKKLKVNFYNYALNKLR